MKAAPIPGTKRRAAPSVARPFPNEEPATAASATDGVADAITRGIRAGTFVPGQHLPEPN